jgi:quercetin dioxygenase-like cupin family protein
MNPPGWESILCGKPKSVKEARRIIRPMRRPAELVLLIAVFTGAAALAQQPVPMSDDPHHKRVLYTANVQMFDVNVEPGGSTLDHAHDHDVVTVALGDTTLRTRQVGQEWSEPRSYAPGSVNITSYTGSPAVHRMENVGKTPYRVFAFENMRDRGWTTLRLITAPATTLVEQSRAFAVYAVRLNASTPQTNHVHQQPTVVILVAGAVEVQGGGGESVFRMDTTGRWFPSQWEQPHTLSLAGGSEAYVVEVEAK